MSCEQVSAKRCQDEPIPVILCLSTALVVYVQGRNVSDSQSNDAAMSVCEVDRKRAL